MSNNHKTEQKILYRIYTESDENFIETTELVSKYFDGFTIIHANGFYKGDSELSIIIEIIADYTDKRKVLRLAAEIRTLNDQESVLVFTTTGFLNEI